MKLTMLVELDVDPPFEGGNYEEREWFRTEILGDPEGLFLHSNEIGDVVGCVRVLEVRSWASPPNATGK